MNGVRDKGRPVDEVRCEEKPVDNVRDEGGMLFVLKGGVDLYQVSKLYQGLN